MRTIKRTSIRLNLNKKHSLHCIAENYAKEKQYWLDKFQQKSNISLIQSPRTLRDKAIAANYQSPRGLQARMWKLALQDAADTMDRYWKSIFEKIIKSISKSKLGGEQKHYLFWILKDFSRFSKILSLHCPRFKNLNPASRKQVRDYLLRGIQKHHKNAPKVKLARSFTLDANCYTIFTHRNRQYISIMSLVPRQRLLFPLLGSTPIQGNIRIVLNKSRVEVHYTSQIKRSSEVKKDSVIGIDFGYTEVLTDADGERYGTGFGSIMKAASDKLKIKMQHRHKLHALQKKYAAEPCARKKRKAKNIKKYNLGCEKLAATQERIKATLMREINTAYNKLAQKKNSIIISEDLSHNFSFKNGKNWNRRLSAWAKGMLKERLDFKALAKSFSHEQVNPAYSSQVCPDCDYVDSKNRRGDKFKCQYCRLEGPADWIAAINLENRYFDREITRFTPYREVKKILLERFHRHLETRSRGTVSGRIPDTALNASTLCGQSESEK